jgi:hypothetical protein
MSCAFKGAEQQMTRKRFYKIYFFLMINTSFVHCTTKKI